MLTISRFLFSLVTFVIIQQALFTQSNTDLWINEIYYDKIGSDTGEFIEIVVQANFNDLDGIGITLYNDSPIGSLGSYGSYSFSDLIKGDTEGSITDYYLDVPSNGIQNGSPDGLSLDVNGTLIQFLSYEGSFTVSNRPAQGVTSIGIGVEQSGAEVGSSISLNGTGTDYSDFQWANVGTNTKGSVNGNQIIEATASNIDDPTIQVFVNGVELANKGVLSFESTLVDNSSEIEIEIKNLGNDTLFISELSVSGKAFNVTNLVDSTLIFNQISTVSVTFNPESPGHFTEQNGFQILSNDAGELSSGLYFYRLQSQQGVITKKCYL